MRSDGPRHDAQVRPQRLNADGVLRNPREQAAIKNARDEINKVPRDHRANAMVIASEPDFARSGELPEAALVRGSYPVSALRPASVIQ